VSDQAVWNTGVQHAGSPLQVARTELDVLARKRSVIFAEEHGAPEFS
jgi:hypothetical protein